MNKQIDFKSLEKKWQAKWEKAKIFEANISSKKKLFLLHPYPYVNLAPHVGHSYTFFRTDIFARYKRMQGFNVLFPQGFHATGEPIVGVAERIRKNDKLQIDTLKLSGASEEDISRFADDPKFIAQFWMKRWIKDLKKSGFSIDWRRTFVTTQMTPTYSRFIEWQYNTLRKKGYVIQGTHPVIWCPHDKSPTGDHDRLKGEGASITEFSLLKYFVKEGGRTIFLPCATLRPETMYGVTNIWMNPNTEYELAKLNNSEYWLVSKQAVEKLKDQKKVTSVEHYDASHLIGKRCTDPISNAELPILPAKWARPDIGTGIVTSVPSHAPWDYVAVKEALETEQYVSAKDLEPIPVVKMEGYTEHPVADVIKQLKIKDTNDIELLEEAKKIIYKKEHHSGIMINSGQYTGMSVKEAKEKMLADFVQKNIADIFYDIDEEVICRCSTKCHVKILENQWFLKYSDDKWKKLSKEHVSKMDIYPEDARNNISITIDWLKDKACARKGGMGTPLPWDKEWIVETLSDSTIYMAYFPLVNIIGKKKITASQLTDEAFDCIFTGIGEPNKISKNTKLSAQTLKDLRKEFLYFYPFDIQNSGKDLVQNHLTFFIMQHIALFPKQLWPKGIAVNGYVNVEGEKMSKSRGNIILLSDMLDQHGSDLTRMNIACSAEGIDDADWHAENIKGYRQRIEFLFETAKDLKKARGKKSSVDSYLQSRINTVIAEATKNYDQWKFRSAAQHALFDSTNELKWYLKRVGGLSKANKIMLKNALSVIVRLIAPIAPHSAEEIWQALANKYYIAIAPWPKAGRTESKIEQAEGMIKQTMEDIEKIKDLSKVQKPKKISIFLAEPWKFEVYEFVLKNKHKDMNYVIGQLMKTGKYGNATVGFIQNLYKKINEVKPAVPRSLQLKSMKDSLGFLENETGSKVEIMEKSEHPKARSATPLKFGILVE
ncbi:MAG: leucine--tRNA ligase [Candidatus Aenigmarchaeota archaeon]|nr:leucine--tRNA ligase [Candidatus Aenigmarchaeota archaeon]